MTPSELKNLVNAAGTAPYFFTRRTMAFFGDTMANYGCRTAFILDRDGIEHECWELWRKKPTKGGQRSSAYFTKIGLNHIHPYDANGNIL